LQKIKLEPNDHILDIGFGNGYLINKLLGQKVPVKIYDIEISNDMLHKVTSKNNGNIENGVLELCLANINNTSFENNLFDTVYTINTIYFWDDLEKCFSEIKRILKPNGILNNKSYCIISRKEKL